MSLTSSSPQLSNDPKSVIERVIDKGAIDDYSSIENLEEYFEIDQSVKIIIEYKYQKVALQFPDILLQYAYDVHRLLKNALIATTTEIFLLADTAYGSCCVDEVAVAHVDADFIIHYGRSCLSPPVQLPVYYVFEKKPLNLMDCIEKISSSLSELTTCILIFDVDYEYMTDLVMSQLSQQNLMERITVARIQRDVYFARRTPADFFPKKNDEKSDMPNNCSMFCGRQINSSLAFLGDYSIIFIGEENMALNNIIMTNSYHKILSYRPKKGVMIHESMQVNRSLMKRYYLVQKAMDAEVFGIIVGTLGVANFLHVIDHIKHIIRNAGRKYYTFVVGKINVAKLANFMEIDMFVNVACPENSLIDSKDFYKPIITPFELEMALIKDKEWVGKYTLDLQMIARDRAKNDLDNSNISNEKKGHEEKDLEPRFSLITGELQYDRRKSATKVTSSCSSAKEVKSNEISFIDAQRDVSTVILSPAANFLAKRFYQGLNPHEGPKEISKPIEGQHGIAKGYSNEPSQTFAK